MVPGVVVMGRLILILGGARSGKSSHAQELAAGLGERVIYLATAEPGDPEMKARIIAHRQNRPPGWITLEFPKGIGNQLPEEIRQAEVIVLDCLTLQITNQVLDASPDPDHPDELAAEKRVMAGLDALLDAVRSTDSHWIVVSNEVGLGLVPPYPLGRLFRDLLGMANRRLAAAADEVHWMAAGIPVPIHPFRKTA